MIRTYTRNTHGKDKALLISTFQKPDSTIRVVLASEELGMVVDLSDIRRTVLYGLPKNLLPATLFQRGGRACRDGEKGEIMLLVDAWTIGERPGVPMHIATGFHLLDGSSEAVESAENTNNPSTANKRRAQDKVCLLKLPQLWYEICNQCQCIYLILLQFFEEPPEFSESVNEERVMQLL